MRTKALARRLVETLLAEEDGILPEVQQAFKRAFDKAKSVQNSGSTRLGHYDMKVVQDRLDYIDEMVLKHVSSAFGRPLTDDEEELVDRKVEALFWAIESGD